MITDHSTRAEGKRRRTRRLLVGLAVALAVLWLGLIVFSFLDDRYRGTVRGSLSPETHDFPLSRPYGQVQIEIECSWNDFLGRSRFEVRVVIPLADSAKLDSGPAAVSYQFLDDPEPTQDTWTVKDDDIWVFVPDGFGFPPNAKFADPDNLHEELEAQAVALVGGEATAFADVASGRQLTWTVHRAGDAEPIGTAAFSLPHEPVPANHLKRCS